MGERKQPNRPGFQRDTWRLTASNKAALVPLQAKYGGSIIPFPTNPGEWELDSTASQLSVIIDTSLSVDENYLQQDGKTTTHKCDGLNCFYLELKRDKDKKVTSCVDHGVVPCLCDREYAEARLDPDYESGDYLPEPLEDAKRGCDLITTLRVILPDSGDVTLWKFASKGQIFNKEVFGIVETLRGMGLRQAYCHLTINRLEKHRGKDVSKFGVARLTLDPNPPNFAAALLANTPTAQARALQSGQAALPQGGQSSLPAPDRQKVLAVAKAHGLTKEQGAELLPTVKALGFDMPDFLVQAHEAKAIGFAALLQRVYDLEKAKADAEKKPEPVEAEIVEEGGEKETDPFADPQGTLIGGQD